MKKFAFVSLVILAFSACTTTGPQQDKPVSEASVPSMVEYRDALAKGEGERASAVLESLIARDPHNNDLISLHALNWLNGKYGKFSMENFLYWARRLGDDMGTDLKYRVQDVLAARDFVAGQPGEARAVYADGRQFCADSRQLPQQLDPDNPNAAVHLYIVTDCALDHLAGNAEAREVYRQSLLHYSTRDNSALKARGAELYSSTPYDYVKLSQQDRQALAVFKLQLVHMMLPELEPEALGPGHTDMELAEELLALVQSDNDSDWERIAALSRQVAQGGDMSAHNRAYLLLFPLKSAYLKDRHQQTVYFYNQFRAIAPDAMPNLEHYQYLYVDSLVKSGENLQALYALDRMFEELLPPRDAQLLPSESPKSN